MTAVEELLEFDPSTGQIPVDPVWPTEKIEFATRANIVAKVLASAAALEPPVWARPRVVTQEPAREVVVSRPVEPSQGAMFDMPVRETKSKKKRAFVAPQGARGG